MAGRFDRFNDRQYYLVPYSAPGKKLVKISAVFDKETRTLGEWKAVGL
jgi:hypothetical protein